jgi:hypothetical protein
VGGVDLGKVSLQEMFVSEGAVAVLVRTDVVPTPEMRDVVVSRQSLFLLRKDRVSKT